MRLKIVIRSRRFTSKFLKYINRKKNDNSGFHSEFAQIADIIRPIKNGQIPQDITSTINSIKNNDIKKYCEKIVSNRKKAMMIHDAISNQMKKIS